MGFCYGGAITATLFNLNLHKFDCGEAKLNKFLCKYAIDDSLKFLSTTNVWIEKDFERLAGFCTNKVSNLELKLEKNKDDISYLMQMPWNSGLDFEKFNFESLNFPVLEICDLAVDQEYQNKGLGTKIINDLFFKFLKLISNDVCVNFIFVKALDDSRYFYEKNGFQYVEHSDKSDLYQIERPYYPMYINFDGIIDNAFK
ncbi:GNAT family N-acetyltransferase [Fructilactobacillus carniphilus]|uniref:GNAT family N-acetyltransferase n=1 Tax=Fructilactobacillus carniphilus TaxID=2940297 RepID=A0ABY5BY26_9LACO|nr:GNAT family N-acetyltransferase [Fructilactobacillus carniphilus]USS90833.1 GNAT family N-acetyltransferase [Fructilactobacillus carniphilus]